MRRKLFTIALILSLGILFLSCGKKAEDVAQKVEVKKIPEPARINEYGWGVPKEPLKIMLYANASGDSVKATKRAKLVVDYYKEKFNVELNILYDDTPMEQRLNLMLASGELPDVIIGMKDIDLNKWKDAGKLANMNPYIDVYGKNIKNALGKYFPRYVQKDGGVYGLPINWGEQTHPQYSAHVRLDYLDELGKTTADIKTPEDYYNILKEMAKKHPTNKNGEKVYALSFYNSSTGLNPVTLTTILAPWGLTNGFMIDKNNNLTDWTGTAEGLAVTKFFNQVYRDGLLDPDSFSNKFEDWKIKFSNERILGHIGYWWVSWNAGHEIWKKLDKNISPRKMYQQIGFKENNVEKLNMTGVNTSGDSYTVVTSKAKNIEEIISFLDVLMTPAGLMLQGGGVPNKNKLGYEPVWFIKENGTFEFNPKIKSEFINGTIDFLPLEESLGMYQIIFNTSNVSQYPLDIFAKDVPLKKSMFKDLKDTFYDLSLFDVTYSQDDPMLVKKQQIEDIISSGWSKAIMSKTAEECETNFKKMRADLEKVGIKDYEAFRTKAYQTNLKNWSK